MWCGVREAVAKLFNSPTCESCLTGGRHVRVKSYVLRLRWAAESKEQSQWP